MGMFDWLFGKKAADGRDVTAGRVEKPRAAKPATPAGAKATPPAATPPQPKAPSAEALLAGLKTTDFGARLEAVRKVVQAGPAAVPPLLAALDEAWVQDVSPSYRGDVREAVVQCLGEIADPRAVSPLLALLQDGAWGVRTSAVAALGKVHDVRAVEPLLRALEDGNGSVRKNAALALAEIGDKRAIEPLQKMRNETNEIVRKAVAEALTKLQGASASLGKPRCQRCGGEVFSESGLVAAARALGMDVVDDSIVVPRTEARRGEELEGQKGFQCCSCGRVYCMGCILKAAPAHRNGGKACFECRSNYKRLN